MHQRKRGLCLLLLLLPVMAAFAQQQPVWMFCYFKGNGEDGLHLAWSRDALNWTALKNDQSFLTPTAGKDKLMRDPCIIKGADGQYHMVWTVSWNEKGIGYASSPDLLHWSAQQYIPVMEHEKDALNCWAPEITYDAGSRTYMIYWATTIPGRFTAGADAGDDKYNHRIYYVTTKDFKTFTPAALLYDAGFNVIDATIVKDGKQYIMFLKDETRTPPQKNIHIAVSKKLTGPYSKPGPSITGSYWAEGPTATKKDGAWIVYFDKYTQHKMGAVTATRLEQWKDISDEVHFPQGTRHGTVFRVAEEELEKLK